MRRAGLLIAALSASCASVDPRETLPDVRKLVGPLGSQIRWDQGSADDAQVADRVKALLSKPLTADGAVALALLRNPGLQAIYEDLGVAQADVVQAGLLKNPSLGASIHFPVGQTPSAPGNGAVEVSVSIAQDFLDIFLKPLRKKAAIAQLDQAKARVAGAVVDLAVEVRNAWFSALGAEQVRELQQMVLEARLASAEFSGRQHRAGNINDLVWLSEENSAEQARFDAARADAHLVVARERLTRLMGLWGAEATFQLAGPMPEVPREEMSLDDVEQRAVARRLDLRAAQAEIEVLAQQLALASGGRYVPAFEVGASYERDPEGNRVFGPDVKLELPLFDQGQARIARGEGLLRQARKRAADLAISIRSDVRTQRSRILLQRAAVERYKAVVVPLRERMVRLTQQQYNAMQLGLMQLLQAKQQQVIAYQEYIEAVRDYWIARGDLERSIGLSAPAENMDRSAAK